MSMRDRWPMFVALTVSSVAVLATGVTAGLVVVMDMQPAALTLGAIGVIAASLGLLAVIRWLLDAAEIYPDYNYRRPAAASSVSFVGATVANEAPTPTPAWRAPPLRPDALGDNVIIFDPARRKTRRAL
jgi:hypothetical protein